MRNVSVRGSHPARAAPTARRSAPAIPLGFPCRQAPCRSTLRPRPPHAVPPDGPGPVREAPGAAAARRRPEELLDGESAGAPLSTTVSTPWGGGQRAPVLPSPSSDNFTPEEPEEPRDPADKGSRTTRRRKHPKEVKEKIRNSLKGRGKGVPKSEEHKEAIRRGMLRKMNRDSVHRLRISASAKGKPKVCRLCGVAGHNIRTCPTRAGRSASAPSTDSNGQSTSPAQSRQQRAAAEAPPGTKRARVRRCSICREVGHNRATCPQAVLGATHRGAPQAAETPPAVPAARGGPAGTGRPGPAGALGGYTPLPLPAGREEMCAAAVGAAGAAFRDGVRLQRIELSLQSISSEGLNVESYMESWPGGIRQQFPVALPLVERVLGGLKQAEGLTGRMSAELVDEADAVGLWQNDSFAAALFPTADTLGRLREVCFRRDGRLVVVVNPQWQREGQVVSDFGFGRARREAEAFVESFQQTFCLRYLRLMGQSVVLYKCYPGLWQLHILNRYGKAECLGADLTEPSYRRIEDLVRRHMDRQSESWLERVRSGNIWRR